MENKYCYTTLLTDNSYVRGVILLNECLRKNKSKYPFLCLLTEDVNDESRNILSKNNIEYRIVDKIPMPDKLYQYNNEQNPRQTQIWKYCLTKFHIFKMTEFDKVIFLDADLLLLKNLDHCFEYSHMTAALDGEYINLWPKWPHFNSGFMVIKPDLEVFNDIMNFASNITNDLESIKDFNGNKYLLADQEILNLYYKDWPNQKELHLNKYYNVFAIHTPNIMEDDLWRNAYFIHFVGTKPWECFTSPEGSRSRFYLNENTSNLGCISFYEVALTMINMVYENDHKNVNWDEVTSNGSFCYKIAQIAKVIFRDFKGAKKFIDKAIELNPLDAYLTTRAYINNCIKAQELYPSIKKIIETVIDDFSLEGYPTLDLYKYIVSMEHGISTDTALNAVLNAWNLILDKFKEILKV